MPAVQTSVVVTTNNSSAGRGYVNGTDSSVGDINRSVTLSVVEQPGYVFTQWEIERIPVNLTFVSYRSNIIGSSASSVCNIQYSSVSTAYSFYEDESGNWYYDSLGTQPAVDGYYAMGRAEVLQVLNQKPVIAVGGTFLQTCSTISPSPTPVALTCGEIDVFCRRGQTLVCRNGQWTCQEEIQVQA